MNTPAARVIEAFGGVRATARALGLHSSSVCRWRLPAARGGLAGRVPSRHQSTILRIAQESGMDLSAEDLIQFGGEA
jgi:hypothetical protein